MKALALACMVLLSGCTLFGLEGFEPPRVVKHPDAPMLVLEAKGGYLRVAVYSKIGNEMIEAGWIPAEDAVGWTVSKYDWEKFIAEKGGSDHE